MFVYPLTIKIKDVTIGNADKKAKAVETIANNLDLEALEILAKKSSKPGMSKKVKQFKNLM